MYFDVRDESAVERCRDDVNLRRDRREPLADIVIELDDPADLFAVDARALLSGSHRIDSGIDELVELVLAQKRHSRIQRIVLDIAGKCSEELAANLVASVRRYGELSVRRANRQHNLIWRQGMRSLISGSLLFVVGIALSYLFTRPVVGEFAGELYRKRRVPGGGVGWPLVPARRVVHRPRAGEARGPGVPDDADHACRRPDPRWHRARR
jgi:hypothetical protein